MFVAGCCVDGDVCLAGLVFDAVLLRLPVMRVRAFGGSWMRQVMSQVG